jgi:hypothetical protein
LKAPKKSKGSKSRPHGVPPGPAGVNSTSSQTDTAWANSAVMMARVLAVREGGGSGGGFGESEAAWGACSIVAGHGRAALLATAYESRPAAPRPCRLPTWT